MAPQYGEVRVDYITYTTGVVPNEGNATAYVSGLINNPTFSGNVIIEGNTTIDGNLNVSGDINASGVVISGITGLFDAGTEALPSIAFALDPNTGIYNPVADTLAVTTGGSERMRIDSTGNVLIGGTLPSAPNITLANDGDITAGTYNTLTVSLGGGAIFSNTVVGSNALPVNTTGGSLTAIGRQALFSNTTGNSNTALGNNTLYTNTIGTNNTAVGRQALTANTEAGANTAVGRQSLYVNTTGANNTGIGQRSLYSNITGTRNTALGYVAGYYIEGDNNTILGAYQGAAADSTLSDTVIISAGNTERVRIDSTGTSKFIVPTLTNDTSREVLGFRDNDTNTSGAGLRLARYQNAQNYGLGIYTSQGSNDEVVRVANTGDVGIGTTSPQSKLHVEGTGRFGYGVDSGINTAIYTLDGAGNFQSILAGFKLAFHTGNTNARVERVRITDNGRVGIGTSDPGRTLHVSSPDFNAVRVESSQVGARIEFKDSDTGANDSVTIGSDGNDFAINTNIGAVSGVRRVTVKDDGNVGIGTTSPDAKLTVQGSQNADPTATKDPISDIYIQNIGGTPGQNNYGGSIGFSRINTGRRGAMIAEVESSANAAQGGLAFFTKGNTATTSDAVAERLRIDHNGDLLIGGTLPSAPNITLASDGDILTNGFLGIGVNVAFAPLTVQGTGSGALANFASSGTTSARISLQDTSTTDAPQISSIGDDFSIRTNFTDRLRVRGTSGDVLIGGTLPSSPNITLNANGSATFAGKLVSASTVGGDTGTTLTTKDYVDASGGVAYWNRTGTTLSPVNAGDKATSASTVSGDGGTTLATKDYVDSTAYAGIPQNAQTSAYTLVSSDNGKHISITTGGVTVPSAVFSVGDTISIYNNSAADQTITQGASVTLRFAGTVNTGNRTLAQRGLATVLCVGNNEFVISGGGLS